MKKSLILLMFLASSIWSYGQLDQFTTSLNQFFSVPEESGFMYFQTPNSYPVGGCFQYYKSSMSDLDNDMELIETHTDNLVNLTHYKFRQLYKNLPVEGAGCIEHYDNQGSLIFTNAKHAINLNLNPTPNIVGSKILSEFFNQMPSETEYAWLDPNAELQLQLDEQDNSATYYPVPELLFAIDTCKNMGFNIDGNRYRLAYKIRIVTSNSITSRTYFMDANTGIIFRNDPIAHDNGPAYITGYGVQTIDSQWFGGFTQSHVLYANDATRKIHTKKKTGTNNILSWATIQNVTDGDDIWGTDKRVETTAHYFTMQCWDYYKNTFGRIGMDDANTEVRVRTHWEDDNAQFDPSGSKPIIRFGRTPNFDYYSNEISIVGHEYTHGVTEYTAGLPYSYESGALDESFSDIFGIVIHSWYNGQGSPGISDWTVGNEVSGSSVVRSLSNPKLYSQPDTYEGQYWYTGTGDNGGVHTNSGVGNKWFYLLSQGNTFGTGATNDNGDYYYLTGIGMSKASSIAYLGLTSIMQSSSEYVDARLATIEAAKQLYGECSFEHQVTIDAWYAVGLGNEHSCTYTLNTDDLISNDDIIVYPNPTKNNLNIQVPSLTEKTITIYDVSGKLLKTITNKNGLTNIDVNNFATGMYTVLINIDGNVISKKVIIE